MSATKIIIIIKNCKFNDRQKISMETKSKLSRKAVKNVWFTLEKIVTDIQLTVLQQFKNTVTSVQH